VKKWRAILERAASRMRDRAVGRRVSSLEYRYKYRARTTSGADVPQNTQTSCPCPVMFPHLEFALRNKFNADTGCARRAEGAGVLRNARL
jgi:hypothetical protein